MYWTDAPQETGRNLSSQDDIIVLRCDVCASEVDLPIVDVDKDWLIVALPGSATCSIHFEDASPEAVREALAALPPAKAKRLRRLAQAHVPEIPAGVDKPELASGGAPRRELPAEAQEDE